MNRFNYVGGEKPPFEVSPAQGRLLKFHIPGSGGCYLGVARIDEGFKLKNQGKVQGTDFCHYEQIHSNHIDWKTNDIRWHGVKIGEILEGGQAGGGYMLDHSEFDRTILRLDLYYSKKYPTAQ